MAKQYGIAPTTLSTLKNKVFRNASKSQNLRNLKRVRESDNPAIDEGYTVQKHKNSLSGPLVQAKANYFAVVLGKHNLKPAPIG